MIEEEIERITTFFNSLKENTISYKVVLNIMNDLNYFENKFQDYFSKKETSIVKPYYERKYDFTSMEKDNKW